MALPGRILDNSAQSESFFSDVTNNKFVTTTSETLKKRSHPLQRLRQTTCHRPQMYSLSFLPSIFFLVISFYGSRFYNLRVPRDPDAVFGRRKCRTKNVLH